MKGRSWRRPTRKSAKRRKKTPDKKRAKRRTPASAPKVNVQADEAAMRTVDGQMVAAINASDLDRWLGFLTDDAILMPPNAPAVVGKQAIREFVSALMASAELTVSHDLSKVEVSRGGDLAYVSYAYELRLTPPEGEAVTDRGKDISVFKKQFDGSWKVVIDIWNSDQPAASGPK